MDRQASASGPRATAFLGAYTPGYHIQEVSVSSLAGVSVTSPVGFVALANPLLRVTLFPPLRFRVTERCGPLRQGGSMCAKRASTGFRRVVILLTYSRGTSRTHSNKNACELDSFSAVTKHALAPFSTHTIDFVLSSLLVSSLCLL